ncbi:MAG: ATP-dependent helicase HrpB [Pseudomonadota bacterium]
MELPIDDVLPQIRAALDGGTQLILAAPPGAGKTTRVPLALMDAAWATGKILVLEPRRIAVRTAAHRMAETLGERLEGTGRTRVKTGVKTGDKTASRIGYRIRGRTRVGPATRVEVITEGILTRMLQSDPELPGISAILFDEVHERSIHTDLGLALALEVQAALRPDLRLVAMSATLDVAAFRRIMPAATVIESAGRAYPVETRWLARPWRDPGADRRALPGAVAAQVRAALAEEAGDALVFLPGVGEITRTAALLEGVDAEVRPLYGALPLKEQLAALAPAKGRRVVLATAIAETSLTVPGVRIVIDAGFSRRAEVDRATGLSRLVTAPVSRAEADQRRGRAGRIEPGICYRMWTKGAEGALPAHPPPEILATDLAPLALELAVWGARDAGALAFIDPPPEAGMRAARDLLLALGALDGEGRITAHGRALAGHPLHPRLAHMMERAGDLVDTLGPANQEDASTKAAAKTTAKTIAKATAALTAVLLGERDPMPTLGTDLPERLRALITRRGDPVRIAAIRDEAKRLAPDDQADPNKANPDLAGPLLALAYPDRIALRRPGEAPRYLLSNGRGAIMDPTDAHAQARLLVVPDVTDGREARIRLAAPLTERELRQTLPALIHEVSVAEWSQRDNQVLARRREMLGAIALSDRKWEDAPPDVLAKALLTGLRERGIDRLPWPKEAQALRTRITWLKALGGAIADQLPDLSDQGLADTLADWLAPHLSTQTRIEQIAELNLTNLLRDHLGWEMGQQADRLAPSHWKSPLGSRLLVDYGQDPPQIAIRLQELFGQTRHPTIGDPPRPLALALLSPAGRPVQVTADLPGFWQGSYNEVRKDMRARYPKHPWPEDPAIATPTRRAKVTGKATKS